MAHNILENRFYGLRTPAWHGLGETGQAEEPVLSVAQRIQIPRVTTRPAYYPRRDGSFQPAAGYRIILGLTGDTVDSLETYGIVTDSYHLLPHLNGGEGFLNIWADTIPAPCETLGVLSKGETIFVTAKLPSFDVKGDEIDNYLAGFNTCDGKTAVRACLTPVRVVCQNTMNLGLQQATELLVVSHIGGNPAPKLREWLSNVWTSVAEKTAVVQAACELLASTDIGDTTASQLFECVYRAPDMPETNDLDRLAAWEKVYKNTEVHRQACLGLFQGSETITSATRGNLWGAYNAVVEYEDYYRSRRQVASRFVGEGAKRKEKAFSVCLESIGA